MSRSITGSQRIKGVSQPRGRGWLRHHNRLLLKAFLDDFEFVPEFAKLLLFFL